MAPIENRTPILVLQHPRERRHPFNTTRLLELCLTDVRVLVDHGNVLREESSPLPLLPGAALLYPGPRARDISSLASEDRPAQLVVIDGTWHQAHTLYRDVPGVADLPHVTLPGELASEFRVRRQPAPYCLSTLEAVHRALVSLEPDTVGLAGLLDAFRRMNDDQLGAIQRAGRLKKRRRARPRMPRALAEDFERLVVAYAETAPAPGTGRLLVSLSAERVATGDRFDCLLRQTDVADAHLVHMGIARAEIGEGASLEAFHTRWATFMRSDDILGVWSHTTLDALRQLRAAPKRALILKAAYRGLRGARGGMDDIARAEGHAPTETHPRRHGRLANAAWVARVLHEGA
jgi:DTW domain-containing protein YfiP